MTDLLIIGCGTLLIFALTYVLTPNQKTAWKRLWKPLDL